MLWQLFAERKCPEHRHGVATLDGNAEALDQVGQGTNIARRLLKATSNIADEAKAVLSPHAAGFNYDGNHVKGAGEIVVLPPLLGFSPCGRVSRCRCTPRDIAGCVGIDACEIP